MSYVKNLKGVFAGCAGTSQRAYALRDVMVADAKAQKQITVLIDSETANIELELHLVKRITGLDARRLHDIRPDQNLGPLILIHSYDECEALIAQINCARQNQNGIEFGLYAHAPEHTRLRMVPDRPAQVHFNNDTWTELAEMADRVYVTANL